jgi:uncharacterized protein
VSGTLTQPLAADDSSLWWNGGDALRSRLFDAISVLLPSGEAFVIAAVSDGLQDLHQHQAIPKDLAQEVERFIREERSHTRAHRLYNDRLAAHAPSRALEHHLETVMRPLADWPLHTRLALASALEHLTAVLSKEALRAGSVWLSPGETPQTRLWHWHCQEELAHHQVARDVMTAAGVSRTRRVMTLAMAMLFLTTDIIAMLWHLLRADLAAGRISGWQLAAQCARFGLVALPSMVRMAWGCCWYAASAKR